MAIFQKFVFDDITSIPVEALLQSERDAGVSNDVSIAEQLEAEREAVRALARAEGFEAGLKHAQSQQEQHSAELVRQLIDQISAAVAAQDARADEIAAEAAELALEFADALAAEALSLAPRATLAETLRCVLRDAVIKSKVTIRVNPDDLAAVNALLAEATASGFDGRAVITADKTVVAGDCNVDWQAGALRLCYADRREAVGRLVATLRTGSPHASAAG